MFIIILGLILSLGCIKSSDSEVEITSLEQEIPESFEDQIKIEIENKNHTGITFVSSWIDGANVTYYEESKDLRVEIVSEIFWNAKHLNTIFFDATFDIIEVSVKHPDKIINITIVGKTILMDAQGHESISEVYKVKTTMNDAKNVNWENLQRYGRYPDSTGILRTNFNYVWIHPTLHGVGVY